MVKKGESKGSQTSPRDVLQPRVKDTIYSLIEQVVTVQKEPQDARRGDWGCAGSRVGGAGLDPAASSPEPPWNGGQESGLCSKTWFGVFQEV